MIDREQLSSMVRDIERYLSDLSEIGVEDRADLERKEAYYAASMLIFAIMNRAIDIGNEIISGSESIPVPGAYRETFDILSKNKVISPGLAADMGRLMKYRNIIAQEYYRLSTKELFMLIKDVHRAEDFIKEIKKFLKR